jgi:hypothetical protein
MNIELNHGRSKLDGLEEGSDGILRRNLRSAAMSDDMGKRLCLH